VGDAIRSTIPTGPSSAYVGEIEPQLQYRWLLGRPFHGFTSTAAR
jgi:hypothetical protein